jgi:hypothetical protein
MHSGSAFRQWVRAHLEPDDLRQRDHRRPPGGRIHLRGRSGVWRHHSRQIELLSGPRFLTRRIDQAISPHEYLMVRPREVRQHVPTAVVGDDNAGEFGRQLRRFRNHPHAGFRPLRAHDDASDAVRVDGDRPAGARLRADGRRQSHGSPIFMPLLRVHFAATVRSQLRSRSRPLDSLLTSSSSHVLSTTPCSMKSALNFFKLSVRAALR